MQLNIQKDQKELKQHGNYEFPVSFSVENIGDYEQGLFLWHWHEEIELTLILSGEIEYHVNNQSYILQAGEGLFVNSNALHAGFQVENNECMYLSVTFHPRFIYGYGGSVLQNKYVSFITENSSWGALKIENNEKQNGLLRLLEEIYQLILDKPNDFELEMHIALSNIWKSLYQYYSSVPEEKKTHQKNIQRLMSIIGYVQDHYNQEISLDDIADHVNICKSECCRFFKKHMNMTIMEYVMFLRVQRSLPMLKKGENITKVSGEVGFASTSYYGQVFKRYMNCTPREYKKQWQ